LLEAFGILPGGDFEAAIRAPRNSKAGVLVCQSRGSNIYLRLGPPRTFYSVATAMTSAQELLSIVGALLSDEIQFVLLSKDQKWSGTTLVRRGSQPAQGAGETARIISWSARFDRRIRALQEPPN
jgi:hypothetical protein